MYVKENRPRGSQADSFSDLCRLALLDLQKIGRAGIVCGPITTGGRGSAEENMRAITAVVLHLENQGVRIFSQTTYEATLWTLKDQWEMSGNPGYCMPILMDFYLPLFQSGYICKAYFLPNWESSFGARWERKQFAHLQIEIIDLEVELVDRLLS
jgi:hypothetical protein